jgi:hypothetical protein
MSISENPVPGYKLLAIEPYTPNIGAVVHGLDLSVGGIRSWKTNYAVRWPSSRSCSSASRR